MSKLQRLLVTVLSGGATAAQLYSTRVLATSPLRYNKLNETSGTAIVDSSGNGYTGTYTGVDLANADSPFLPNKAPFWDGTNDYGNLHSAAFATAFNYNEFTLMLWFKMNAAGVWTDAANRFLIRLDRDASNTINIRKTTNNNELAFTRTGGGTTRSVTLGSQSDTAWVCLALSCSVAGGGLLAAGELRAYKNGAQVGSTQTGNINATGSGLTSTATTLGAATTTPALVHHGYLAHAIIWNSPMSADKLALMTV